MQYINNLVLRKKHFQFISYDFMICSSKSKGVIMKSLTKKLEIIESRNIVFFPVFARMNSFILNLGNRAFPPLFSIIPHNPYHSPWYIWRQHTFQKEGSTLMKLQIKRPIIMKLFRMSPIHKYAKVSIFNRNDKIADTLRIFYDCRLYFNLHFSDSRSYSY